MSDIEVCIELPGEEQLLIIGALRIIKALHKEFSDRVLAIG